MNLGLFIQQNPSVEGIKSMKKPAYEAVQTTPQRGVVYSLCVKTRAVNTVHTGTGKGAGLGVQFRACKSSRQGA